MRASLIGIGVMTALLSAAAAAPPGSAAELSGPALVGGLRHGGYVLVMRHASSPQAPPGPAEADPGNPQRQRQLDEAGRAAAAAMGRAIRTLHIRIGRVWSSPAYRALETARLAALPAPTTAEELGDHGQSMSAATQAQSAWLRARTGERPAPGTDTLLITHQPNIAATFGQAAAGLGDGEALVFRPDGHGHARLIGRIPIEEWPVLAGD